MQALYLQYLTMLTSGCQYFKLFYQSENKIFYQSENKNKLEKTKTKYITRKIIAIIVSI